AARLPALRPLVRAGRDARAPRPGAPPARAAAAPAAGPALPAGPCAGSAAATPAGAGGDAAAAAAAARPGRRRRCAAAVRAAPGAAAAAGPARPGPRAPAAWRSRRSCALRRLGGEQGTQRLVQRPVQHVFDAAHAGGGQAHMQGLAGLAEAAQEVIAGGGAVTAQLAPALGFDEAVAAAEGEVALLA